MQIIPGNIAQAVDDILGLLTCRRKQGCIVIDAKGKSATTNLVSKGRYMLSKPF